MGTISNAFNEINRSDFVPEELEDQAYLDVPLPIGYGQTISQPYTVNRMLEWLDVRVGDIVLDVGSGSGWTTALLSNIVGHRGMVYAVEKVPELLKFGKTNCRKYRIKNVKFYKAHDNVYGLPEKSPYNRILVSASADNVPDVLVDQLTTGGKMVIPVKNDILEITKKPDGERETIVHPGFIFVPLV
jgi:protein-L-isoaspartate(D-aspartate) O-methyltransferase